MKRKFFVFLGAQITDNAWSDRANNLQAVMRLIDSKNIQNLTTSEARKTIERAVNDIQSYMDFLNSVVKQRYPQINYAKENTVFEAVAAELERLDKSLSEYYISGWAEKNRNFIIQRYFMVKVLNGLVAGIPESLGRMDVAIRKVEKEDIE